MDRRRFAPNKTRIYDSQSLRGPVRQLHAVRGSLRETPHLHIAIVAPRLTKFWWTHRDLNSEFTHAKGVVYQFTYGPKTAGRSTK